MGLRFQHVYLGGSLVASQRLEIGGTGISVTYRHTDALGSPIAATDAAGSVVQTTEHEPYGRMLNRTNDNRPGYTGHVMDQATGMVYMQQRYYDSQLGRFLSVDPITAYSNPVGAFNRYWYANNNPYRFTDPDGRQSSLPYIDAYLRHYYRNGLNNPPKNREAAQSAGNWRQMSDAQSVFHQQGEGGAQNSKWVDDSGHHEAIYDGNGNLVTDRLNGGTYNYASPDDWGGHLMYDVLPYFLWRNGPIEIIPQSVMGSASTPASTPTVTVGPLEPMSASMPEPPPPPPPPEIEQRGR